jgi:hypothetical protein
LHPISANIFLLGDDNVNHNPKRNFTSLVAFLFVLLGIYKQTVFAQQSEIPLWEYSIVGPSNNASSIGKAETYKGFAVGTSPLTEPMKTTTLPVALRTNQPARRDAPSQIDADCYRRNAL